MFARVWQGMRVSLYIAFIAAGLDLFVGVTFGAVSGLLGGKVDGVMQRIIEILNGIPILVVAILAMVVLDPGILTISIAIGAAGWTPMARLIRGRVLQLKDQEFTLASRSLGAGNLRLLNEAPATQRAGADNNHADAHHPERHLHRSGSELHRVWHPGAERLARLPH